MKILIVALDNGTNVNTFPLGIGYLASTAKSRGYNDITIYNQEVYHYKDSNITKFLDDGRFDLIGIGIYGYHQYKKAVNLCKYINASKNRPLVALGSHGPTAEPEHFIKKMGADIVVMG